MFKTKKIIKKNIHFDSAMTLLSAVLLGVLLFNTSPDRIGPIGITITFVLLLVLLVSFGMLIIDLISNNPSQNSRLLIIILAVFLVSVIALNTVALGWGDAILFALFASIFFMYWVRLRRS